MMILLKLARCHGNPGLSGTGLPGTLQHAPGTSRL
jgi:hypothetical protein